MSSCILVCEDEKFIRWALAEHLRSSGYQVIEAENGLECVEQAQASHPDAILLDLRMPKMDGTEALKKLRAMGIDVPIFVLSGYGSVDSHMEATELGADGFVPKPYHLSEISQLLKIALNRKAV